MSMFSCGMNVDCTEQSVGTAEQRLKHIMTKAKLHIVLFFLSIKRLSVLQLNLFHFILNL
jgi:hypothetical protein